MKLIIQINSEALQKDSADIIEKPILVQDEDYSVAINSVINELRHCDFDFSDDDEDSVADEFIMFRDGDSRSWEYVTVITYDFPNIRIKEF